MTRQQIADKIEDIIWKNIHVLDDSGLHLGDAIEEIMELWDMGFVYELNPYDTRQSGEPQ